MTEATWKNKKMNIQKLLSYGFTKQENSYIYSVDITDGQMKLIVTVSSNGTIGTEVIDNSTGEEYVLHRVPATSGAFVGQVKTEHERILEDISETCFEPDVFKSDEAKAIITYVKDTYDDAPEFLWKKFPDNAIFRRKDTGKWYAALLTVSKRKLGIDSDNMIEILDLHMKPDDLITLIDHKKYFPGYHMNKKYWYTICLDGSVPIEEICRRIEESYLLAVK